MTIVKSLFCYAQYISAKWKTEGIRIEVDDRNDRMNAKIRDAQNQKIPYRLVVGDREMEQCQVALRFRNGENPGAISLDDFIQKAKKDIANSN